MTLLLTPSVTRYSLLPDGLDRTTLPFYASVCLYLVRVRGGTWSTHRRRPMVGRDLETVQCMDRGGDRYTFLVGPLHELFRG